MQCEAVVETCEITRLKLLRFSGADAQTFLQGQLTADVRALEEGKLLVAGYCNAQGRLIAVFWLYRQQADFYAVVPADLVEMLVKRLKMYILRSKVKLDVCADAKICAVFGSADALPGQQFALASVSQAANEWLQTALECRLVILSASEKIEASEVSESKFWAALAASGFSWVRAATKEMFIPQAVNLELIGGVSFTKGCYTGQEIVSRLHFRGTTPRRAALYGLTGTCEIEAGTELDDYKGIVLYSGSVNGQTLILAQVAVADTQSQTLQVNAMSLKPLELPYVYQDL